MLNRSKMIEERIKKEYTDYNFFLIKVDGINVLYTTYPTHKEDISFKENVNKISREIINQDIQFIKSLDKSIVSSYMNVIARKSMVGTQLNDNDMVLVSGCNVYSSLLEILHNKIDNNTIIECMSRIGILNDYINHTDLYTYSGNDEISNYIRGLLALCSKMMLVTINRIPDDNEQFVYGNSANLYFNLSIIVTEYGRGPGVNCFVD